MALEQKQIAFIGGGHITEIIISNFMKTHIVEADHVIVSDPNTTRLEQLSATYGVGMARDNRDAVERADIVFVNVIPQVVSAVVHDLQQANWSPESLLVTLAAGIPMKTYEGLAENLPVVRALPNPPSQIGQGIAALAFNPHVTPAQHDEVMQLFGALGESVVLKEELINVVTSLSSPASVYQFFQAMVDAGVRCGIDRKTSTKIVYQTIVGSMEVWNRRQVPPSDLVSEASTPGGVSVECLFTLDKYAFTAAIKEAIAEGALKATEFSNSF